MSGDFVEVLTAAVEHGPATAAVVTGGLGLRRVIGPSLDAIGETLGKFTQYRAENLLRIGEKAEQRIEHEAEGVGDAVHPRVAKEILEEGSWIDDDLHQEYLAGLLVGSRSEDGKSDARAYLTKLVTGLTAHQIHLHYAVYRAYAGYWTNLSEPCPMPWADKNKYREHSVVVDVAHLEERYQDGPWFGLGREGLLSDFGNPTDGDPGTSRSRFAFVPSALGADVFLAGFAASGVKGRDLLCMSDMDRNRLAAMNPRLHLQLPPSAPAFPSYSILSV